MSKGIRYAFLAALLLLPTFAAAQNVTPFNETIAATTPVNGCMFFDQGSSGGTNTKLCASSASAWAAAYGFGPLALSTSISAALDTIGSTQGGILYRGASAWTYLGPGTSGQFLQTSGGNTVLWATPTGTGTGLTSVGLSVPTSSIFGVTNSPLTANGTIGLTTAGTTGGVPYFSSTSQLNSTAAGTAGQVLTSNGASPPNWTTPTGGGGTPVMSIGTFTTTGTNVFVMASPSPAVSSNTAYYRVCGYTAGLAMATTPAPTLAAGTAPAMPILLQNQSGIIQPQPGAFPFTGATQSFCAALDNSATHWVIDFTAQSVVYYNKGTYNVTAQDWANNAVFVNTSGTNALVLPSSANVTGGGITIVNINNASTLAPQGSDTLNGATGTSTLPTNTGPVTVTLNGTAFTMAVPELQRNVLTWREGLNLSTNPMPMLIKVANPLTILAAECDVATVAGGAVTLQLKYAATAAALASGTNIGTTCNANSATLQTGLLTAPVSVPGGNTIGLVATGTATSGAGVYQFRY